jgi:hypothetical protein
MLLSQLAQASADDGGGVGINLGVILLVILVVAAAVYYVRSRKRSGGDGTR